MIIILLIYHIYSIETLRMVGIALLRLNFTAVHTFKNKNYEHRRFESTIVVLNLNSKVEVKTGYSYSSELWASPWVSLIFCSALPVRSAQLLLICHSQKLVTDRVNYIGPSRSAHAMSWFNLYCLLARHSTAPTMEYNSVCSMLMSDDLWLPKRGIEPRSSGFREVGSTARPLPLPRIQSNDYLCFSSFNTFVLYRTYGILIK